ncbi:MAG: hypothetical protein JWM81_89 [Candidatus Saccharibacteria bacterium]|nr:hypothetical protein [Candidatus Saccharibacteria bacterium]
MRSAIFEKIAAYRADELLFRIEVGPRDMGKTSWAITRENEIRKTHYDAMRIRLYEGAISAYFASLDSDGPIMPVQHPGPDSIGFPYAMQIAANIAEEPVLAEVPVTGPDGLLFRYAFVPGVEVRGTHPFVAALHQAVQMSSQNSYTKA